MKRLPNAIDWVHGMVAANLADHPKDPEAYKLAVETIQKIDKAIEEKEKK